MPVQALMDCKLNGISVTDFLTFIERETGRIDLGHLNPSWFIFSHNQAGKYGYESGKRFFDVFLTIGFLLFTLPLLLAVAAGIRIDSPGPVFYRQERVGLNGRRFSLLKFRTMRMDAEADGVPQWAEKNDPRITRVGRMMRRTRIDEIPQLINVMKGDMSLVGPRPERPFFVDDLGRRIPYYSARHRMKPGLTGWAQINYQYTNSVEDAKVKTEFDLYYVKNHSAFLDLIIVLLTLKVIDQRDERRHESRRTAAGTAVLRRRPRAPDPILFGSSPDEAGAHGMGADQLPVHEFSRGRESQNRIRSLLCQES